MMQVTHAQMQQIIAHANAEAPHEACGLIAGVGKRAQQIIPMRNDAAQPHAHFEMPPGDLLRALKRLDTSDETLLGIYHSHPNGDPIPSPDDIRAAQLHYPQCAHVIIGTGQRVQAWRIHDGQVDRVALHIGGHDDGDLSENDALSRAQIAAILLTLGIAFAALLVISITLLPPAPPITAG